jgi:hypothetical protein
VIENGMPKLLSPAKMKKFSDCKNRKEKLEAAVQSGELTAAAYAKTLVRTKALPVLDRRFCLSALCVRAVVHRRATVHPYILKS